MALEIAKEGNPYNLSPVLQKRLKQFQRIDDNTKKFQMIIEIGKKLPALDLAEKTEDNQVKGCTSLTYVKGDIESGALAYKGESNSHLVKGLLALLVEGFNGLSPQQMLDIDPKFIEEMGLNQTLTASRANGFMNTYMMMKNIAIGYLN